MKGSGDISGHVCVCIFVDVCVYSDTDIDAYRDMVVYANDIYVHIYIHKQMHMNINIQQQLYARAGTKRFVQQHDARVVYGCKSRK